MIKSMVNLYEEYKERKRNSDIISYGIFIKNIEKRSKLKLQNIYALSKVPEYFKTDEYFFFNDFYGLNYIVNFATTMEQLI
jgi:cellulose biosynthesis protein BcsQ